MIEKITKILLSKYEYTLDEYALYEIKREKSKFVTVSLILFSIIAVLFLLDAADIFSNFMNLGILIFGLFVLVLVPLALRKGSKHEAIIVTPEFLIQRTGKSEFSIIRFDDIISFIINNDGINISDTKTKILLGLDLFREEIEPIVEILEAKGKTFDKEKEYMIRPIEVKIENNKIIIIDIEKEDEADELYCKYSDKFEYLTPGFFDQIIFRNSSVDSHCIDDNTLVLFLDSFEVKNGHPENTTFDSLDVSDCMLALRDVNLKELVIQELNKENVTDLDLDLTLEVMAEHLNAAVISDWKHKGSVIDLVFATGVQMMKVKLECKDIIIGWNNIKKSGE